MSVGPAASRSLPITRAAWALAALVATVPLLSLQTQSPHLTTKAGIAALALFAALRPLDALLLYAGLTPLATILALIIEPEGSRLRLIEAATLAVLAGWAARRAVLARPLEVVASVRWSVAILLAAALASLVVSAAIIVAEDPASSAVAVLRPLLIRDYLVNANPLTSSLQFAEGLALVLLAADICTGRAEKRDRVLRMMVMGASAAAVFNLLRITFLAARTGGAVAGICSLLRDGPCERPLHRLERRRILFRDDALGGGRIPAPAGLGHSLHAPDGSGPLAHGIADGDRGRDRCRGCCRADRAPTARPLTPGPDCGSCLGAALRRGGDLEVVSAGPERTHVRGMVVSRADDDRRAHAHGVESRVRRRPGPVRPAGGARTSACRRTRTTTTCR